VTSVRLVPDGEPIPFQSDGRQTTFRVPRLECHAMVELQT